MTRNEQLDDQTLRTARYIKFIADMRLNRQSYGRFEDGDIHINHDVVPPPRGWYCNALRHGEAVHSGPCPLGPKWWNLKGRRQARS